MTEQQLFLKNLYNSNEIRIPATNSWISGDIESNSLKNNFARGCDDEKFCNLFVRVIGANDKTSYARELFYWKSKIENNGKTVTVLDGIPPATVTEVEKVAPQNYTTVMQMLSDLTKKLQCSDSKIRNQAIQAFIECIIEESEKGNFGRLRNRAISLVCWFNRYIGKLYNSMTKEIPVIIYFGACKNESEALMLRFFASLPIDVILINTNLNENCIVADDRLYDIKYDESLELEVFPDNIDEVSFTTVAYNAEKDLETVIYDDTGLFRLRQHSNAIAVTLRTMYEEIFILWDQEIKLRPSFEILNDKVVIPTITAKINGVKDGDLTKYWNEIQKLDSNDCFVVTDKIFYDKEAEEFNTLGAININKINRENIISNKNYRYSIYREEIQSYILDKLEELIESQLIKGTFEKGTEHTIIKVIMCLDKRILRLIQNLDFTKKNPKLVLINTSEESYRLEESIIIAYLHLIGFDVMMFTPTGYRVIENNYTQPFFVDHNIGNFMFDLNIPNIIASEQIGENVERNSKNKVGGDDSSNGFFKRILKR